MDAFFSVVQVLVSGIWDFFTELDFPGLPGISIAMLTVGLFLAVWGIRLVCSLFGLNSSGDSPRTSSTSKPKISKERKHDEF